MRKLILNLLIITVAHAAHALVTTPSALNTTLGTTNQAALISLSGVNVLNCPQVSMSQTWNGGKLIFSDSPESPTNTGMLYMDTNLAATAVSVTNRLFVYHVNNLASGKMRFSVLIQNNGASNGTLTVQRTGLAGPSSDYSLVGQDAFLRWLTNPAPSSVTAVTPGQIVRLDTTFDTTSVSKGQLLHGIWDYTFDQPHTVMICALNPTDNPLTVGPTLPVLARDTHERGTFASCNKFYDTEPGVVIDTAAGIQQFPIAGNGDNFITGFDNAVTPPTSETETGNYGVLYYINMTNTSSDGQALGFLITPRGGSWSGTIEMPPGLLPGGSFLLPAGAGTFSDETEAAVAGAYLPAKTATPLSLQFMPTGGVSFPIRMMAVPFAAIAPTLAAISNYTVNAGQTVAFTAVAADANTNKTLTFSVASGPPGAVIGAANGAFQWRPPVSSAGSSNNVQLTVSDNSTPPLTASRSFVINVNPLTPVTVALPVISAGQFQFQISGPIGPDYILQANSVITNPNGWVNLLTNTPVASPFIFTDTNSASFSTRYYRIQLGP